MKRKMDAIRSLEEKLNLLKENLEEGRIHVPHWEEHRLSRADEVRGDAAPPMPSLSGKIGRRHLSVDFLPGSHGHYQLSLYIGSVSSFKAVLRPEGALEKVGKKFGLLHEISTGESSFDERYLIEAVEEEKASKFLAIPENRELILKLEPFLQLTIEMKFVRLSREIGDPNSFDAGEARKTLQILEDLAGRLEKFALPSRGK